MNFKDFGLNKHIIKAINEKGFVAPTLVQIEVIPKVLDFHDLIVSAQTGTGKTAAFLLPIIHQLFDKQEAGKKGKKIKAIILSPTRELASQIEKVCKDFCQFTELKSALIYGGVEIEKQKKILDAGVDIVIGTPGRILDLHKQNILKLDSVEKFILDEADLMLDMGFIQEVTKINKLLPQKKQSLLFSATISDKVQGLANNIIYQPIEITINENEKTALSVKQSLFYVTLKDKNKLAYHILNNRRLDKVLVFRRTKYGVEKLEQFLIDQGVKVLSIHGAKTQSLRNETIKSFRHNGANVLIATDVASRGIDIEDLDLVINFDMPEIPETYIHRIGRVGRAQRKGESFSFCGAEERDLVVKIENLINNNIPVDTDNPFVMNNEVQPTIHKRKGSKYKKGRKSEASKKKKKRWY